MKSTDILAIFIVVALAQLFVPARMIFNQETVVSTGTAYKFKTQPIDPSDPFKGKYIYLNYNVNSASSTTTAWKRNEPIYLLFKTDSLGFATIKEISKAQPNHTDYLKTAVTSYDDHTQTVWFSLPFNEFYMNEHKAYDAEIAHSKAQRDSVSNTTYALVYILNGTGVLDNVFINDIPIAEYVER